MIAEVFTVEPRAFELVGAGCDHDRVRRCESLQARGQVRRLSDHRALLGGALADNVADHHRSRRDAYAHREIAGTTTRGIRFETCDGLDELEPGAYGTLCVILVGARISEVGEHAVAHVAGDVAIVAFDGGRYGILIAAVDIAQLLRVEPPG